MDLHAFPGHPAYPGGRENRGTLIRNGRRLTGDILSIGMGMLTGGGSGKAELMSRRRLCEDIAYKTILLLRDRKAEYGYRITERTLMDAFGVSNTPVRVALRLLMAQGIVTLRPQGGYVVAKPIDGMTGENYQPVDAECLSDVVLRVADAWTSGKLRSGFSRNDICQCLGVGSREADLILQELSHLHIFARRPGNGWEIEIADSNFARAESYAFRQIVEREALLQPDFHPNIAWLVAARSDHLFLRQKSPVNIDVDDFRRLNSDFHIQLARFSGNAFILKSLQKQMLIRDFYFTQWLSASKRVHDTLDEHLEILGALIAGNNRSAAERMSKHLSLDGMSTEIFVRYGKVA